MYTVPFLTVKTEKLAIFKFIEMGADPEIIEGKNRVSVDLPLVKGVFSDSTFLLSGAGHKTGTAVEIMMDELGRKGNDKYTKTFYEYFNLPNFVRVVAFLKIETPKKALIGVRPVTSIKRTLLCREIDEKKRSGKLEEVRTLVNKLKSMRAGSLEDLFPFVFQLYPICGKIMKYKIFAICVGKNKNKTAFEVITNEGSNFVCEINSASEINLRNRNGKMLFDH